MDVFTYTTETSYEKNFLKWRAMNNDERDSFNEERYTDAEARRVFDSLYGNKLVEEKTK
tara:strand:+ start:561 stop:737 length:177 start_codon:yes stop_codon:yes gene_type:complete